MAEQQEARIDAQHEDVARIMGEIAEKSRTLVEEFLARQQAANGNAGGLNPNSVGSAFLELTTQLMANPLDLMQAQFSLWQDYLRLWHGTTQRLMGQEPDPVIAPERGDRRFKDAAWNDNVLFDFIKQSYLLTSRFLVEVVKEQEGLDDKTQQKVDFYTRQFVDALAPTNFVATNPEVLKLTIETRGENLLKGLKNMLDDLERGRGRLAIRMTDLDAFEIGKNVGTTPGKVVFQNDLMQLIQYEPTTEQVHKRPLLIVPPWINKFYILDLQPKNSFIRFCVEQGFTTFVVSWVNPDEKLAHKSFEDYMQEGPLAALDAMRKATGEREATAIGYCLGGTLMASTMAYLATKRDTRLKAVTFFTALVDFKNPGELGVFIDEEQLVGTRGEHVQARLSRRRRDGHHLQPAARQRPHLVVRDQQLSPGQGAVSVRPPLLELRQHAHAGRHAQLLSAPLLPREQADRARCRHPLRHPHRPAQGKRPDLLGVDQGGPHRPLEEHLRRHPDLSGREAFCSRRLRPHRGRRQPAGRPTNTAFGPTTPCRPTPTNGSPAPPSTRAPGGRTGPPGTAPRPARKSPPASPATASSRSSRTRRAAM